MCVLGLVLPELSNAQDDLDPKVRLYVQRVQAYLNRMPKPVDGNAKKPRDVILELLAEKAKQFQLPEAKQRDIEAAVNPAIGAFATEVAKKWLEAEETYERAVDGESLQKSTMLFELSAAWNRELSKLLDKDKLKAWNEDRDRRLAAEKKAHDEMIEQFRQHRVTKERRKKRAEARQARLLAQRLQLMFETCIQTKKHRRAITAVREHVQYRKQVIEGVLAADIERVNSIVPLTDKQRRRLELATKGVVSKDANAVSGLLEQTEEVEDQLPAELCDKLRAVMQFADVPRRSGFWQRSLASVLGKEAFTQYQAGLAGALQREKQAWAMNIVLRMHQATPLSVATRERIVKALADAEVPRQSLATSAYDSWCAYILIPEEIRRDVLDPVLSEEQRRRITTPGSNMRELGAGF